MSIMLSIALLVLLVSSTPSLDICWNMFNTSVSSEFSYIGYGDWCVAGEGAHPGIDFKDPSPDTCSTVAICPATDICYVRMFQMTADPYGCVTGWTIWLAESMSSSDAWQIAHLHDIDGYPMYQGKMILPSDTLAYIWTPELGGYPGPKPTYWFNHIHLMCLRVPSFTSS